MTRGNRKSSIPKEVSETAIAWLVRRDDHNLTPEEETHFNQWLQADPLHQKAWNQVQGLWSELDQLPKRGASAESTEQETRIDRLPAKRVWVAVAALAASLAFFFLLPGHDFVVRWSADSATAIGEIRPVPLPDGSTVHLNTASAIDIEFTKARRTIRLLQGEAEFHVSHDPSRPFVVEAAGGYLTALGTAFVVRLDEDQATLTVLENRVEVSYPDSSSMNLQRNILTPAQQIVFGPKIGLQPIRDVSLENTETWSRGKLIFENKRLGEVIRELNRYHPGSIQVIGESLRETTVNGVFPVHAPVLAVNALEASLQLKSQRLGDLVILLYR